MANAVIDNCIGCSGSTEETADGELWVGYEDLVRKCFWRVQTLRLVLRDQWEEIYVNRQILVFFNTYALFLSKRYHNPEVFKVPSRVFQRVSKVKIVLIILKYYLPFHYHSLTNRIFPEVMWHVMILLYETCQHLKGIHNSANQCFSNTRAWCY